MGTDRYYSENVLYALFGVSRQRLYYWRKIGLFPGYEKNQYRGYDFTDLLTIKIIKTLLDHGARASDLSTTITRLKQTRPSIENPLLQKRLFLASKEICIYENGHAYEVLTGQLRLFKPDHFKRELKKDLKKIEQEDEFRFRPKRARGRI